MPNHVDTILRVEGSEAEIKRFLDTCIIEELNRDYNDQIVRDENGKAQTVMHFDFNTIIPVPPELEKTVSPTRTDEDYQRAVERGRDEETLKELKKQIKLAKTCQEKYGCSNWYDFKCTYWGTKWGAYDYREMDRGTNYVVINYQTAWSPATPVLSKLGEMFPSLHFISRYIDEGWCYYGEHVVWGKEEIDNQEGFDCKGVEFVNFANDFFGYNLAICPACGEVFNPEWSENDQGLCESCFEEKENA